MKKQILTIAFLLVLFGFGIINAVTADREFSKSERRRLQQFPELTAQSVTTGRFMEQFEVYTQDQFVGREAFRRVKAVAEIYGFQKKDNNDIYLADGYASALEYPLSEDSVTHASEKFGQIYAKYLEGTDCEIYYSVVPDKNYFLADAHGYPRMDYEALFSLLQTQNAFMKYVDIIDLLDITDYYRTDTHWKQECLEDVADRLIQEMETDASDIEKGDVEGADIEMTTETSVKEMAEVEAVNEKTVNEKNVNEKTLDTETKEQTEYTQQLISDEFYGVYAGQSALPLRPDELICLENDMLKQCVVYNYETRKECPLYDMELAKGKDPYEMYLSGSVSLMTIENPNGHTGKELILFRDSFGSSLAPLLMAGYDKITLVDTRYLPAGQLGNYLTFENQDVLFLYSTLVLNHSETLK